jgi:hypothetical protein
MWAEISASGFLLPTSPQYFGPRFVSSVHDFVSPELFSHPKNKCLAINGRIGFSSYARPNHRCSGRSETSPKLRSKTMIANRSTKTEVTKWTNGWEHTKEVVTFADGQVVTTITSKKEGCLFTFEQFQDVWSNGRTRGECIVLTPGGRVQHKLSAGIMTLAQRCAAMDEMSDWIKSQEGRQRKAA